VVVNKSNFPAGRKLSCDFVPRSADEARRYADWVKIHYEREDWDEIIVPYRERRRRLSVTRAIRQARKAGERGPVSVTLPDGTIITSENESSAAGGTTNPWDTVLMGTRDATH
jgi:hypothetical protein